MRIRLNCLEHWSHYYGRRNDFRECCCHLLSFDHSTGAGHVIDRCGHGLPVVYTLLPFGEQGTKERNFFNPPHSAGSRELAVWLQGRRVPYSGAEPEHQTGLVGYVDGAPLPALSALSK